MKSTINKLQEYNVVLLTMCSVASDSLLPHGLLSMGFPRGEHWSALPFLNPGDLPNPGMEPTSDSLPLSHLGSPYC